MYINQFKQNQEIFYASGNTVKSCIFTGELEEHFFGCFYKDLEISYYHQTKLEVLQKLISTNNKKFQELNEKSGKVQRTLEKLIQEYQKEDNNQTIL